ncbi:ornithine cyclodeaminase [Dryocola clanedunensis]|uniref:ornithine cyclodeaminase n=1 Tax=Cedecea sulfonylureivorans TaxID=3051154 RepID=UPI001928E59D|nr:ornithine cyclodeaminase [Cedecea sulfonylureivorans]
MSALRYLTQSQVAALGGTDPQLAFDNVVETVKLMRKGEASMPAETHVNLAAPQGKVYALQARVGGDFNATGVKWTAHRPQAQDGYPMAMAMTLLNRADNGLPVALLQSGSLTATRTAAVSALALKYASPVPPRRILLLGAGVQACAHLKMLAAQFPELEQVDCWNRTPSHLEAMLDRAGSLPWPTQKLTSIEHALAQSWDTLITCTSASQPFIGPQFIQPGRMVMQIGYHEVSFEAIARADKVVVDGWGDYCATSAKSLFQMYRAGGFTQAKMAADLANLVVDNWRAAPGDSVYFSSFGLNVFDIALAARVAQEAERQDVGTALPLEFALS